MFNNDMFAGGHRPDITKIMQAKKDGTNINQSQAPPQNIPNNEVAKGEQEEKAEFDLSSVSRREEETKAETKKKEYQKERSRSRSKSPKSSRMEKPKENTGSKPEMKKEEQKEPTIVEESKIDKPLSKEEKLRLAKEKLMKRKTEQPSD